MTNNPVRIHIIHRGSKDGTPNLVSMARSDFVVVVDTDGTAKCIKQRDDEIETLVTYEYINKQDKETW